MMNYIHLDVHSEYSIYDSVVSVNGLIQSCVAEKMPAVAITDLNNLYGVVKFYKKAVANGIKPIIGAEVWIDQGESIQKCLLLCQNNVGLNHLRQLISKGFLHARRDPIPILDFTLLAQHQEGLLAILVEDLKLLEMMKYNEVEKAQERLADYKETFTERFYVGLRRLKPQDKTDSQALIQLASVMQIPVVATNAVRFLNRTDFEAHEARICIQDGMTLEQVREKKYTKEQYLKSASDMCTLFSDVPSALENSIEVAKRCNVQLELGKVYLPDFPVPEGETIETFLEQESRVGLKKRWLKIEKGLEPKEAQEQLKAYEERLNLELGVINSMGFAGYFMIVADFIRWAKENDIPVGPGRGSGAGSIVAYVLDITDLDPIQYELLFERFLNPERVSMPDFDVDFCMENRDRVIEYVSNRYGAESVSQIVTFGTMAAKAVVRDVGRVLGHPYGFIDKIAKLIPFEIGMTLDKALVEEEALSDRYRQEEEVRFLIDLARKLEGTIRNVGKHAGGVVIAPTPLTDFSPLYCEEGSTQVVTQYDKDDVESIGLVKFDFLGLRTLTIIHWAVKIANQTLDAKIDITEIPLDCPKTYDLLKACQTTAVFQLESRGMKDLINRLQPDTFEEIIALVALFRPGPLQSGMVDDFIDRKHGRAVVAYPHPDLEPILSPTYGVILYQEQVMQIAQVLAGYTLGGADLLRRAMGKKKLEEMAEQREIFVTGSVARGVEKETATYIFDLMEKFAGYGFNKSHSAAYALVSYQTAWLKTHYPSAFMAAALSSDMNQTEKVVILINEVKSLNLSWLAPDINHSFYRFCLNKQGDIVFGLGAIKGVGEGAIQSILDARALDGPFLDLFDFCERIDCRKANKRVLEALIKSGCLDSLKTERHLLLASIESALKHSEQKNQDSKSGQTDMFAQSQESQKPALLSAQELAKEDVLKFEKNCLGFYLSGHPIEILEPELKHFVTHKLAELPCREMKVIVAGMISQMRTLQTKKGDRMAFVTLDDNTEPFEIAVFSDLYQKSRSFINKDELLVVTGNLSYDKETKQLRLRAEDLFDLAHARDRFARRLKIQVRSTAMKMDDFIGGLKDLMKQEQGSCFVVLEYVSQHLTARIRLGEDWQIMPSSHLIETLKETIGRDALNIEYD